MLDWFGRDPRPDTWRGLVAGLAGGFAGSLVMGAIQAGVERMDGALKTEPEEPPRWSGGTSPAAATTPAAPIASPRGVRSTAAMSAVGAAVGGIYGIGVEHLPILGIGEGIPAGAVLMIAADEALLPALNLAPAPMERRLLSHVATLTAGMSYGLTTELVRRGVRDLLEG